MKIHKLSPLLISKIAAGEVIERPAFAIKELIENAIDAKATEIKVYLEESGLKKLQVTDNGEGMSEEDLQEAWKPHTTSKITHEDELHTIQSLGFRGEALASLAAVSRLTIKSKINDSRFKIPHRGTTFTEGSHDLRKIVASSSVPRNGDENAIGFQVVVESGKLVSSTPVGMASGTSVTAEHLFETIPARKKFLKSPQTELRHSIDTINNFAVAYPEIKFVLIHHKRTLLDYPSTKDISERVEQLIGSDTFSFFIPLKKSESYVTLHGFIAKPQMNSTTQSKQFLFVNNRKVNDKLISSAVKEAFGTMLESTTYPLFVLFVSVPFEMVDVNVHPRKEQVSFVNNQFIFQTTKELISEVLQENNITFQNLSWKRTGVGMTKSYAGQLLKDAVLDKENFGIDVTNELFQLNKLYIVGSTKSGLVLIDQHAAHERILFEKLREEFIKQKNKHVSFTLKEPIRLELTKSERLLLEENESVLEELGFKISHKGTTFFKGSQDPRIILGQAQNNGESSSQLVPLSGTSSNNKDLMPKTIKQLNNQTMFVTHLPTLFQDRYPLELLKGLLESLVEEKGVKDIDKTSEEMLAFLACRAAVKAGDLLAEDQMRSIVQDLETTANNITCPHGRPTRIVMSLDQLNTLFGR